MDSLIDFLESAITATAWKIDPPKAYGLLHLSFMIVGFTTAFLVARRLRNLSDAGNKRLLLGIGSFLLLAEIYKQLLLAFVISPDSYSWGNFPFHMCSVPMYLCIIAPLLPKGKLQSSMYSFMMLYNLLGGGIAFFEPSGLLHGYATLTAHSLVWHMLLVFIGLYLMFSGRGGFEMSDYKNATKLFLILSCIAFAINLAFRNVSDGKLNMFFVGPSNSSLIVFKQISEAFGWYVSTAIYIPAVCFGAYIIFYVMQCYHNKTRLFAKNAEV